MKKLFIVLVLISVPGCVPPKVYRQAGITNYQQQKDLMLCTQNARGWAATNGVEGNMFVEVSVGLRVEECMRNLGYQ